jgi:peroxiredoxin Q/BCP
VIALAFRTRSLISEEESMLAVGAPAPAFTVRDDHGREVRLSDLKGRRVVLWFYPKADTPG